MAEWNKGKVLPQNLHNNQEFKNGDNLAINELNAIVNNSFYASEKADRAEQLAESAVKGNGSLVTINGQIQGEWSADFAEAERQKSKNLFDLSRVKFSNIVSVDLNNNSFTFTSYNTTTQNSLKDFADLEVGKTYRLSVTSDSSNKVIYFSAIQKYWHFNDTVTITQEMLDSRIAFYGTTNVEATVNNVMITAGSVATDYQPYNGSIVHEKDIADVEHIEVIYDKNSTDANINKGQTSGVMFDGDTTPSVFLGSDSYQKYKGFYVYVDMYDSYGKVFVPNLSFSNSTTRVRTSFCLINNAVSSGTVLFGNLRYENNSIYSGSLRRYTLETSSVTLVALDSKYHFYKIEGVLR